jgi:hypothetical protein
MTPIFSAFIEPSLMSPRTAKYVEAMIREGDQFDYDKWLKRVREQEAQAKQLSAPSTTDYAATAQIGNRISSSDSRHAWPRSAPALVAKTQSMAMAKGRSNLNLRDNAKKARLRRRFERVDDAWNAFQTSRARDAVYEYLDAVFSIVMHYRVRRRTKRLLRHAFRFAKLQFDKNVDPFTAIIRCTCGDAADNKMVSKWARALRYAARRKPAGMRLKAFMKTAGGVNACAARYARLKGRHRRSGS